MDTILTLVNKGNDFLWSFLLLILLCGTGIYYTIRLKFIQVRKFGEGCKHVFGHFSLNGEKHEKGEMSPFQSIMTAIAAQVGTGNLAGAATALFGGGPGAIFWMWLSAFFGMATIYSEAVLAQTYKTEVNGEVTGGPVYYIKAAFKGNFGKVLSTLFAIFIVLALGFMGNMVQSNSIGAAFTEVFQVYGINIPHTQIHPALPSRALYNSFPVSTFQLSHEDDPQKSMIRLHFQTDPESLSEHPEAPFRPDLSLKRPALSENLSFQFHLSVHRPPEKKSSDSTPPLPFFHRPVPAVQPGGIYSHV